MDQNDFDLFLSEMDELKRESDKNVGPEDIRHLQKIQNWGRLCTLFGYATAWLIPNPVSVFLLSQGRFSRWTVMAHHILHQGYDRVPGIQKEFTSKHFARSWRRYIDWFDWIDPEAWAKEHNHWHHYHLGEINDPDVVEHILDATMDESSSSFSRYFSLLSFFMLWKPVYYAPSVMKQLQRSRSPDKEDKKSEILNFRKDYPKFLNPFCKEGRELWAKSWGPYFIGQFVLIPLIFGLIGVWAAMNVLINSLLAELLTNIHSFLVIVPNHTGEDLYRFESSTKSRKEFIRRQILGSANYRCGGDLNDFLHGWLNYQIEHHIWPSLTLRQYQILQPRVKALCLKYKIPYAQDSLLLRVKMMIEVFVGKSKLRVFN